MSTNYYAVFDEDDDYWEGIHLTKFSGGWRPSIQWHGVDYGCGCDEHHYRNFDEFKEFIFREDIYIKNEYGETVDKEEFMDSKNRAAQLKLIAARRVEE